MTMDLKTRYKYCCDDYVKAFAEWMGFSLDYFWVGDNAGTVLFICDYYVDFDNVRLCAWNAWLIPAFGGLRTWRATLRKLADNSNVNNLLIFLYIPIHLPQFGRICGSFNMRAIKRNINHNRGQLAGKGDHRL